MRQWLIILVVLLLTSAAADAQWLRAAKSRAFSRANAIAADNSGFVYTGGISTCITIFDGDSLLNNSCGEVSLPPFTNSQLDAFLSKHDEDGNLIWVKQYPGSPGNTLAVNDLALDNAGNCYLAGSYTGSLLLGTPTLVNNDITTEFFLAKIRPDGVTDWRVSFPVNNISETSAQKVSVTNNAVYITGYVRGNYQIGAYADSLGNNASFVAAFDLNGNSLWTKNLKEINADGSSMGKAIEAQGDSIWVFSSFTDSVKIENDTIDAPGTLTTGGVIALYNAAGNLLDTIITSTPFIEGIKLHRPDASLYITGRAQGRTTIGGNVLFAGGGARAFVSSRNPDLSMKWVRAITAPATAVLTGRDLDVNADGSILVAGIFSAASVSGPSTTAAGGGGQNGFLMKLDATGDDLWLQSFGGTGEDALVSVSSVDDDRIFASGYFNEYVRVVGEELFGLPSVTNGFMARIDICPQLQANMISPDSTYICTTDSAQFQVTANAMYTYQWFHDGTPVTGAATAALYVKDKGSYRAQITGLGCTKLTPLAKLFLHAPMDPTVLTDDPLESCAGDSVRLRGSGAKYVFEWMNNGVPLAPAGTIRQITVMTDGDYFVRMTDTLSCMVISDTFNIRFYPYPLNTITPAAGRHIVCSGDTITLAGDASLPGLKYSWKKNGITLFNDTLSTLRVSTEGRYNVMVSNAIGCQTLSLRDTVVIQESPLVDLNNETAPSEVCQGNAVRLITPQVIGQAYQWIKDGTDIMGANANLLDVDSTGQYQVRVDNGLCVRSSDTFDLTVRPLPAAAIINNTNASICEGDVFSLQAQQAVQYSYEWLRNNQVMSGATSPDLSILQTGRYKVRVTNEFNCKAVSSDTGLFVTVNRKPPAVITAQGPATFCTGNTVELRGSAGAGFTYQWMRDGNPLGGATLMNYVAASSGQYEVRVTNNSNCSLISPPVEVQVVPIPVATIASSAGGTAICDRDSLLVLGGSSPSYTYTWLVNGQPDPLVTSSQYYAKLPGAYTVVASVGNCRDTSGVLSLTVRPNPLPIITRNGQFLSIALFGDIQWYRDLIDLPGATQQAIQADADGSYSVRVINNVGCTAWSDQSPMCLPVPDIEKENDELTVSIEATSYIWEYGGIVINGATQRQLKAQQSGDYSVVVTSLDGCVMETYPVTVCVPYPYITQDSFSGVLKAFPNPATSYQWYYEGVLIPDGTTQVHIPDDDGSYTVMVTDIEGCTSSSEPFVITPVTGADDELLKVIKLYPNPVQGKLVIERTEQSRSLMLTVVDALGREVHHTEIVMSQYEVNFEDYTPGVYTVIIQQQGRVVQWKVVKI